MAQSIAKQKSYDWLRLIRDTATTDDIRTETLIELSEELVKILTSIVKTGYEGSKPDTNAKTNNSKLRTKN